MTFDLNTVEAQISNFQIIPPDSYVYVRIHLLAPGEIGRQQGAEHPMFCKSLSSSLEYLNTTLEVVAGQFQGVKLFHNFNLAGAVTQGQQKAIKISMAQIRALVEASNGISPRDASPQATQLRRLNDITDIEGMVFPIKVTCEKGKLKDDGIEYFCKNVLKEVITIDDPRIEELQEKGELISDNPVPSYPKNAATIPTVSWANKTVPQKAATQAQPPVANQRVWGTQQVQTQTQTASYQQAPQNGNRPNWAPPASAALAAQRQDADPVPF